MIAETLAWISSQSYWVEPIVNFLIVIACIKYILFGWR